jgi:hypothetical protein
MKASSYIPSYAATNRASFSFSAASAISSGSARRFPNLSISDELDPMKFPDMEYIVPSLKS